MKLLRKMLSYGFPVMIGGLAGMVNETFDRIALKHLVTIPDTLTTAKEISDYKMSQIGIYGACYKLSIVISLNTLWVELIELESLLYLFFLWQISS